MRTAEKTQAPKVSVVIVNWNGRVWLEGCIESVRAQTFKAYELIVVDNASTDGSRDWLKGQRDLVWIGLDSNTGYTGGANRGFARARGEWALVMNPDVVLESRYLETLMKVGEALPQAGLLSGLLLDDAVEDPRVDSAGQVLSRSLRPRERWYRQPLAEVQARLTEGYVFSVCGAVACYRTKMLKAIGGYDESFFAYSEDLDLAWRAQENGWAAYFTPQARAYHRRGANFTKRGQGPLAFGQFKILEKPDWLKAHVMLNRYAVLIKHAPLSLILVRLPFLVLTDLPLLILLAAFSPSVFPEAWTRKRVLAEALRYRWHHAPRLPRRFLTAWP